VRLLVLLTKVDKLNRNDAQKALREAGEALGELGSEAADIGVSTFSALSGQGVADVAEALRSWVPAAAAAPAAVPPPAESEDDDEDQAGGEAQP
jgi:GTP-binding protein